MIKFLKWDSNFFFKKIGLLDINDGPFNFGDFNSFDLVYVISDDENNLAIDKFKKSYSETKVTFSKNLIKCNDATDCHISKAIENDNKKEIYNLALESGKFSRFNLDDNFSVADFRRLYYTWIDNSFKPQFADAVLVYKLQDVIVGFVTYTITGDFATIGLIAVSPDYQSKGIGKKLINAVERNLLNRKIGVLRIPTQFHNHIACEFYANLGFKIIKKQIINHYWRI